MGKVECFCGCGRLLRGSGARLSEKEGKKAERTTDVMERFTLRIFADSSSSAVLSYEGVPLLEGPDASSLEDSRAKVEELIDEGRVFQEQLAELVHGERSRRDFDRRAYEQWAMVSLPVAQRSWEFVEDELRRQGVELDS